MKKLSLKIVFRYIPIFSLAFLSGCDSNEIEVGFFDKNKTDVNGISEYTYHEEPDSKNKAKTDFTVPTQTKTLYLGVPDDPIYFYQWHLKTLETENIWDKYTGTGIKVAVIDSGIEVNHPDLFDNIDFNLSYRYSDYSHDPSPDSKQLLDTPYVSAHGTACAGIIGAKGWNNKGVIGVAPTVDLVGFNTFSTGADADFEDALGNLDVDISSNSWGGQDSLILYDDPASMRGVEQGIKYGRDGKGVIYIFASGNEGNNANYSTLHGSRYIFNIGAVIVDNEVPNYSNFGDNVLVVAPAGDELLSFNRGIFTTDLIGMDYGFDSNAQATKTLKTYNGDYTGLMNGTSSAVPVVSGIVALILEANPELTYRDLKYILAKTAKVINLENLKYSWEKNSAGIYFSPYYGFGIINLIDSVKMAEDFTLLKDEIAIKKTSFQDLKIPDNNEVGISANIEIEKNIKVEHITVTIDIPDHRSIGDLEIILISPAGTVSKLMYGDKSMVGRFSNWDLNSLKFLDETSKGDWTLKIRDRKRDNVGTLKSWKISIYGRED